MLGHWFVLPYGSDPTGIVIIVSMWTLLQWLCKQAPYCNVWFANTVGDIYVVVICCLSLFFFFLMETAITYSARLILENLV